MHRSHRSVPRRARTTRAGLLATGAVVTGALLAMAPTAPAGAAPAGSGGRFERLEIPGTLDLTNLPRHADPGREVSAVVQLDGAAALQMGATDLGVASRQVLEQQATIGAQVEAAGAAIDGQVTTVMNALLVRVKARDLAAVAAVPGVARVHVSRTIHLDNGTSTGYTGVNAVWQDLGLTGAGTTIAIIDDGIDYYHADFGGVGGQAAYAADDRLSLEPGTFPTAKVVAGYDFAGDAYDADADEPGESTVPAPDPDPLACGEHGTHVAGTAAGAGVLADGTTFTGPYDATTATNSFLVAPGAAPEALLQAYKVFGCDGSSDDSVILAAIDAAVANGADVINMSLGETLGRSDDPLAQAVDAASAAGVVVVVSAGNEGPGAYVVGGPSTASSAISVAAVDAVPMLPGVQLSGATEFVGQNSNQFEFVAPITGELVDVGLGCSLEEMAPAAGKIAIATRGECDRVARPVLGTQAGALAVIFVNDALGLPPVEGPIEGAAIPFVGTTPDGGTLLRGLVGQTITLSAGPPIENLLYQFPAGFTSSGPRLGDSALKPDIAAPGVNVLSAHAGSGTDGALLSGTSMAAPHAAGIAALVRQSHPGWDPAAIKGAMMATAAPDGVGGYTARLAGAGLVDARSAVDTVAFISTEDGLNNLSYGFHELTGSLGQKRSFHITNTSAAAITYDLDAAIADAGTSVEVTINPSTVTVPAGESRRVTVKLRLTDPASVPGAASSDGGLLAAIEGFVIAQPHEVGTGIHRMVTPLLLVPSAVSDVRATGVRTNHDTGHGRTTNRIKLYNKGVHAGDADFYQWAISDPADSPDPLVPDIREIGVQSLPFDETGSLLVFAVNTEHASSTQSVFEYDILIDTTGDGVEDFVLIGADTGLLTTGIPDGTMGSLLIAADGTPISLFGSVAPANGSTVLIAAPAAALGNPGLFAFVGVSATVLQDAEVDVTDVGWFDPANPAVTAVDPNVPGVDYPFVSLAPGEYVPVDATVDRSDAAKQRARGWLVVTTDDAAGRREADRVALVP